MKRGLGYICLLTLLMLFFYRDGLRAQLEGWDLHDIDSTIKAAPHGYVMESWKPVSNVLLHLAYLSFGLNPLPYHLVSLVLYISTLSLLYSFYSLLLENKAISKIAVLLFATFYFNTETVNHFTSNREMLKTLFGLATLIYFAYYRKTHCLRYYALALLFGILANLSEETAVCLPLILLVVDCHILQGIFPPKLLPLKNTLQSLLPHLPFWLMALAVLGNDLLQHESHIINWGGGKTLYDYYHRYSSLVIYAFSPCYLAEEWLTIKLGWIIMGGIGWLFYRSTPQKRSLIAIMAACAGFSLMPFTILGPVERFFFFTAVLSMLLVTLLTYEIGGCIYGLLEERLQGYRLSAKHIISIFTTLILLPSIYLNYVEVRQYNKNLITGGELIREIVEGTVRTPPQGAEILYVNLPIMVNSGALLRSSNIYVGYCLDCILELYGRQHLIPEGLTPEKVKAIYLDLGYERVWLDRRAWYDLKGPSVTPCSKEEFNSLSKDEKVKLLFFNPVTNRLMDVCGWSYEQLKESITPYIKGYINAPNSGR